MNEDERKREIDNLFGNSNEGKSDDLSLKDILKTEDADSRKYDAAKEFYTSDDLDTDIRTKTDLSKSMVMKIVRLNVFKVEASKFETNNTDFPIKDIIEEEILKTYYSLRISVDRKGRNEFFEFLTSKNLETTEERKGLMGRIFGR